MKQQANTQTATFLAKDEFETFKGGQNAALRLTAYLWGTLVLLLFALAAAVESGRWEVFVPVGGLVFVLIGWVQASLSNGFHEAVHYNFGEKHSDGLALALLGYPTFFTLDYRTVHMQHHRYFGDPELDPDFETFSSFPRTRIEFIKRLVWMGCGVAAAIQLVTRVLRPSKKLARSAKSVAGGRGAELLGLALTQLTILALFSWILSPLYYVFFWMAPLGTVGKLAKSTRAFCEHGSPDRPWVLRTITGSLLQTGTLGTYDFHFHAEHHLYPWVPYARLEALYLRHQSELEDPEYRASLGGAYEFFDGGYFRLLWKWFKALPWQRPAEAGIPASD